MADKKGKGRAATLDQSTDTPTHNDASPASMLSRVAASASGLTKHALGAPSRNELDAQAKAVLTNSGKGQSSSYGASSSSTDQASDVTSEQRAPGSHQQGAAASSLRSGHSEQHVQKSENEFLSFLDGIDSFIPSGDVGEPSLGMEKHDQSSWGEVWANHQLLDESAFSKRQEKETGTVAEQEKRDGADVLALLSEPVPDEALEAPVEEEVVWHLSAEQRDQIRELAQDILTTAEPHGQVKPYGLLNLVPSFEASNIMRMPISETETPQELYLYTGINRESFREQWNDVLYRYADEVWGDILPLVVEARREVEEMEPVEQITEMPSAVRRLQAILQHLNINRIPTISNKPPGQVDPV
ncbi:hypothetical protein PVAG01_07761 [Phlyctema vagabunda]|uniref:Uncharacterized protein n=1 Tax=Phlyctema vagabunda TaxID=108571 RepID=A0ABR4PDB7_9HELO